MFHRLSITYAIITHKTQEAFICFSIEIDRNINKLSDYFGARLNAPEIQNLRHIMNLEADMPPEKFNSLLGLKNTRKRNPFFKVTKDDGRVFSNYFTNIITQENDERLISPMRYRIRPENSKEEVPIKYNVFNARLDSLEIRNTWSPLFMKRHGIIPFTKFFEWVEGQNKKPTLISFYPKEREIMWAPILWDEWISKDGSLRFKSFAIITDGPPSEIEVMGHDRCPIFLNANEIDNWLNPKNRTKEEIYKILSKKENVVYDYKFEQAS